MKPFFHKHFLYLHNFYYYCKFSYWFNDIFQYIQLVELVQFHQILTTSSFKMQQKIKKRKLIKIQSNNCVSSSLNYPLGKIKNLKGSKLLAEITNINDNLFFSSFNQQDYNTALQLLEKLSEVIKNNDDINFKKIQYSNLWVIYNNMAIVYKQLQERQMSEKFMELSILNLQLIRGFINSRQQNVGLNKIQIVSYLQHCVMLSQNSNHECSIEKANLAMVKLSENINILLGMCYQNMTNYEMDSLTSTIESHKDNIDFEKIIFEDALEILKQLSALPSVTKLMNDTRFESLLQNLYNWDNNEENNQRLMLKTLNVSQTRPKILRNALGLQSKDTWVKDFHIGKMLALKPLKIVVNFMHQQCQLLTSDSITELIFMVSTCYFTIATQMRFLQEQKQNCVKNNKLKILHLKAIELSAKYLPPKNQFLTHLIKSFNHNYKKNMDVIKEQLYEESIKKIQKETNNKILNRHNQYGIIVPRNRQMSKNKNNSSIDLLKKSVSRKKRINSVKKIQKFN